MSDKTAESREHGRTRIQAIAADIRAQIMSGDLMPGEKLPSTPKLMTQYGAHSQTVQNALKILKDENFIEGQAGKGVFVLARAPQVTKAGHYPLAPGEGQPYPWITDHASQGRRPESELLFVGEVPAPAQVAAAFGIAKGDTVAARKQVLKLDGQPYELVWTYYPTDIARGTPLAENRKMTGGSPRVLTDLGYPLHDAIDRVSARLATEDEFSVLQLPLSMPILRDFRVVFTSERRPVEVQIMVKAGQFYEIEYHLPESGD